MNQHKKHLMLDDNCLGKSVKFPILHFCINPYNHFVNSGVTGLKMAMSSTLYI